MVSHCPDKFGGGRYFGSEDMFLVVEVQDFTCSLKSVLTVFLESARHESTLHVI